MPVSDANVHTNAKALQDTNYDTDGDGYVYVGAGFYADVGSDGYAGSYQCDLPTVPDADDYFTADRDRGHITAVTHHHPDGSAHDAIPDFHERGSFECVACGATYRVIVWRTTAD